MSLRCYGDGCMCSGGWYRGRREMRKASVITRASWPLHAVTEDWPVNGFTEDNVGLRALLKGPAAMVFLLWLDWGLNCQPQGSQSSDTACLTAAAECLVEEVWALPSESQKLNSQPRHYGPHQQGTIGLASPWEAYKIAPNYLQNLIQPYTPAGPLRCAATGCLALSPLKVMSSRASCLHRLSTMSRASSTAKRYTGSSYSSHYGSYSSSLSPALGSYSDRDKLSYKSTSSGYTSSSYLGTSAGHSRNYSTTSEPDRGRPIPRSDLLAGRRSESLSRTPAKSYGSGLSGGRAAGYPSYSYSPAQSSYLSTSSSISLSRRKSVSQTDLSRDLSTLGLKDSSYSSSSSLKPSYRSRASDVEESYSYTRSSYGLSRSSTQDALSSTSYSSSPSRDLTGCIVQDRKASNNCDQFLLNVDYGN
ncbi:hypothetical protein JZ751_021135 [Albula glossodonta]|uniref:Uncharacterized protein n=1 Tax=Albula glossodonta TaxID=121402 RepID=A0A8T2PM41_9TELE|nr:hypothetical protein JZ751_021135 [Albula glossodonta]